jgi:hypothetical protein
MDPGLAFGPLGLVPAIFLLYITLGPYETKFEDKIVFLSFIGGMVLGTIVLLLEGSFLASSPSYLEYIDVFVFLAILFSFFDQLSKLIILNLPRFHKNVTTSIYGASLGLGLGTPIGALILRDVELFSIEGAAALSLVLSFMLFQSSTGALIGLGVGRGKKWTYFFYSFISGAIFWPMILLGITYYQIAPLVILYSVGYYLYLHRVLLPEFLIDRKTRRQQRRQKTKRKLLGKI